MNKSYQYLDIDVNKKIHRRLRAVQGDTKSRYILVSLYNNSMPFDLSNCSVKIFGVKSDKKIFFNYANIIDTSKGQFEIELTSQALAVNGELQIQILVLGANQERLTTCTFFIDVDRTIVDDNAIQSENEFTALTKGLADLAEYDTYKNNVLKHDENLIKHENKLNEVSSQLEHNTNDLNSLKSEKVNVIDFGAFGDGINDDTNAIQNAVNYAKTIKGTVYFPKGTYLVDGIGMKDGVSYLGENQSVNIKGKSNSTKPGIFYIDDAPVQYISMKNLTISGHENNEVQNGLHLEAIEQSIPAYTGGIWYSVFENIHIGSVNSKGIFLEAIDKRGDLANQFLTFINVKVFRPGLKNTERCLVANGQLGQTKFINCSFDSLNKSKSPLGLSPGINVELDGISDMSFDLVTIQNSEIGIKGGTWVTSFNVENCWFENIGQSIVLGASSFINVHSNHFANACHTEQGTGYCLRIDGNGSGNFYNNFVYGNIDKIVINSSSDGLSLNNNRILKSNPVTQGVVPQYEANKETGELNVSRHKQILVNVTNTTLLKIIDRVATGEEITLRFWSSPTNFSATTITSGGNISLPFGTKKLMCRHEDSVTLIKTDIGGTWYVKSCTTNKMYSSSKPTNGNFIVGEIVYNSKPTAGGYVGWICIREGVEAREWSKYGTYALNELFRPPVDNGFYYKCISPGKASGSDIVWPTNIGDTVQDGPCIWECVGPASLFKKFGNIEN